MKLTQNTRIEAIIHVEGLETLGRDSSVILLQRLKQIQDDARVAGLDVSPVDTLPIKIAIESDKGYVVGKPRTARQLVKLLEYYHQTFIKAFELYGLTAS